MTPVFIAPIFLKLRRKSSMEKPMRYEIRVLMLEPAKQVLFHP